MIKVESNHQVTFDITITRWIAIKLLPSILYAVIGGRTKILFENVACDGCTVDGRVVK